MHPHTPPLYRPSPLRASTTHGFRPSSPSTSALGSGGGSAAPASVSNANTTTTTTAAAGSSSTPPNRTQRGRNGTVHASERTTSPEPDEVKVGEMGGIGGIGGSGVRDGDGDVREYEEKRDRLAKAIESSLVLLADLRNFNEREWTIRYPLIRPGVGVGAGAGAGVVGGERVDGAEVDGGSGRDKGKGKARANERPRPPRRTVTLTLADDPTSHEHQITIPVPASPSTPHARSSGSTSTTSTTSTPEVSHMIDSVGAIDSAASHTGREGASHAGAQRKGMKRSVTVMPGSTMGSLGPFGGGVQADGVAVDEDGGADSADFSILRLDLSLGHQTVQNVTNGIMSSLNRNSISSLLSNRLTQSLAHLQLLQQRIASTSSRVLVTGDLNAGKSTLVNALLRRGDEVMPVDQQPLTGRFVEVFGDEEIGTLRGVEKGLREEVHVPKTESDEVVAEVDGEQVDEDAIKERNGKGKGKQVVYDRAKEETYTRKQLEDLYELVLDQEASSPPLKVYLRPPHETRNPSILHNGILDISLIDAPGLNRDVLQTTSNFASSSSIDVIVFVVSAANHFTLSAKEFILSAGQEKARMFIVVNRFDEVRDKERCKRLVLEQIKRLSPGTWEERDELVHFVDSAKVAYACCSEGGGDDVPGGPGGPGGGGDGEDDAGDDFDEAFKHLEQSLRSFVLVNRAKSKLGPAETYLTHLMADLDLLAGANAAVAEEERDKARQELARIRPILDGMKQGRDGLDDGLEEEEDRVAQSAAEQVRSMLVDALENIGHGRLATEGGPARLSMPGYPGLLGAWDYAAEVRRVMLQSIELAVTQAENHVRRITSTGVAKVAELGDTHLPKDVERSKRVFNADAMFAQRRTAGPADGKRAQLARRRSSNFGTVGLDLGLTSRQDLLQVTIADIIDFQHLFVEPKLIKSIKGGDEEHEAAVSPWGMASVAAGAVTVFGGQALGMRTLLRNAAQIWDFLGDASSRRMIAPVTGAVLLGLTLYVVHDLPSSIPRNVGRHLHLALLSDNSGLPAGSIGSGTYPEHQTIRMQREARKVIRLASWDLRERFKAALEARGRAVEECEGVEKRADKAVEWFREVEDRVTLIREQMKLL